MISCGVAQVTEELRDYKDHYCSKVGESDWKEGLSQAESDRAYLSALHIVATANVTRRPVYLYSSQGDIAGFGAGFYGVAGSFWPSRLAPSEINPHPICVAWQSTKHNHYVALCGLSGSVFTWPDPAVFGGIKGDIYNPFESVSPKPNLADHRVIAPTFVSRMIDAIKEAHLDLQAELSVHGVNGITQERIEQLMQRAKHAIEQLMQGAAATSPRSSLGWQRAKSKILQHHIFHSPGSPFHGATCDVSHQMKASVDLHGQESTLEAVTSTAGQIQAQVQQRELEERISALRSSGVIRWFVGYVALREGCRFRVLQGEAPRVECVSRQPPLQLPELLTSSK